jgi:hypothetical protein
MEKSRCAMGIVLALVLLCSATSGPAAEEKAAPNGEAVFELKEVSLFDEKGGQANWQYPMFGMQEAAVNTQPAKEVKAYPKLNSKQPLYGSIVFSRNPERPRSAVKFYFVLDESKPAKAPAEKAKKKADEKAAKKDAGTVVGSDGMGNLLFMDVVAPEKITPSKYHYDRLYLDVNHDLDLTNDAVASPMKEAPKEMLRYMGDPQNSVVFDTMRVAVSDGSKADKREITVLPVSISVGPRTILMFMGASARKGEIRLGKKAYSAMLFSRQGVTGRLDGPETQLILTPLDGQKPARSYPWLDMLGTIRQADGEFYRTSATPSGDKLTVRPIGGERGVFELSAGKKGVKPLGMAGILRMENSMLLLGDFGYPPSGERAQTAKFSLPVGDYQALILNVDYGDLQVSLRDDYTRVATPGSKQPGKIEVRKDKPYVLDFSTKPEVFFQSPLQEKTFKPGDAVRLAAMMRLPERGFLIGGLDDMSKKIGETNYSGADGKMVTAPRYASLEPTVVISDSAGKKVAEGTMPFG